MRLKVAGQQPVWHLPEKLACGVVTVHIPSLSTSASFQALLDIVGCCCAAFRHMFADAIFGSRNRKRDAKVSAHSAWTCLTTFEKSFTSALHQHCYSYKLPGRPKEN